MEFCLNNKENCEHGTQWSVAFTWNATVLFLSAINLVVMLFGAFFWWPRLFGTYFNFCYACCHCSAFLLALGVRFNPVGELCAINVAPSEYLGDGEWSDTMTY